MTDSPDTCPICGAPRGVGTRGRPIKTCGKGYCHGMLAGRGHKGGGWKWNDAARKSWSAQQLATNRAAREKTDLPKDKGEAMTSSPQSMTATIRTRLEDGVTIYEALVKHTWVRHPGMISKGTEAARLAFQFFPGPADDAQHWLLSRMPVGLTDRKAGVWWGACIATLETLGWKVPAKWWMGV